jgi:hypothetical protein
MTTFKKFLKRARANPRIPVAVLSPQCWSAA